MIAKIIHGSSLYGAISYNQQKVDEGKADIILTRKIILSRDETPGNVLGKILQSFESYIASNPRVKKPVVHISINPDPKDVINAGTIARIADDYMQQMGYGDQPYIIYRHRDIDRIHYHIISVNIDENGQRISDRYEKLQSMAISRELEKKYGLVPLTGERDEESRLYLKKVDYSKGDVKRQISNTVRTVLDTYGFQSFGEYNALLSVFNIHVKHVRGEEEGNFYNGIIYCAVNNKGETIGNPIKSSRIGKSVGYEALQKKMEKTAAKIKSGKIYAGRSKGIIREAMSHCSNRKQFEEMLKLRGIDVVFRQNEQGRIYGVTFIDHTLRLAYNGSRLGKEFSANAFQNLLQGDAGLMVENRDASIEESSPYRTPASVDEIFGTFYLNSTGRDAQEEAFGRMLRRGKKKGGVHRR